MKQYQIYMILSQLWLIAMWFAPSVLGTVAMGVMSIAFLIGMIIIERREFLQERLESELMKIRFDCIFARLDRISTQLKGGKHENTRNSTSHKAKRK